MVKVGVDDKASEPISKTSKTIQDKLATAAKAGTAAMAAVAAGTVALATALMDAVNAVSEYGDTVDKTSQKLGVSAEAYQKWDYVMNISGTSMQNMTMGLKTLTNKLDDAKNGSSDAQEMFAKLGLSMEDLNSMSREDAFEAVIRGFQGMEDSTERAALANDLFGRSGQELTPLFNTSIEETQELMENAERLGFVMGEDDVKAAAAFKDAQTTLQKTMDGLRNSIASKFLPAFTTVSQGMTELLAGNMDKGKELIREGVNNAVQVMRENGPALVDAVVTFVGAVVDIIKENGPVIMDAAMEFFGQALQGLAEIAPQILNGVLNLVVDMIGYVISHVPNMLEAVVMFIATFGQGIQEKAPEFFEKLVTMVADGVSKVLDFAKPFLEAGAKLWSELIGGIKSKLESMLTTVKNGIQDAVNGVLSFVGNFLSAGAELINNIIEGVSGVIGGIATTVSGGIQAAVDAVGSFVGEMWSAGWNVVQGIIDGIWSNIGNVASTILSGFRGAVDTVKSFLGIASPSKLFAEIGKNTMLGMAEGIEDNMAKAQNAMRDAADAVYGAGQGEVSIGASYGVAGSAYGVPGMFGVTFNGPVTIEANDPEELFDKLAAMASISRHQYA